MRTGKLGRVVLILTALGMAMSPAGGCAIVNHLLYVVKGATVPAEFKGLEGKRVAVVCISPNDDFGPDSTTVMLSRGIEQLLKANVDDIQLVRHEEVANWIDRNNWQYDYLQIGRGVKADMVLAVDMSRFSLHEGSTLYKGYASATISVFDMSDEGSKVYHNILDDFAFPARGAQSVTDISEASFKRAFVKVLAENIARFFYDYDIQIGVAPDPANVAG